MPNPTSCPNVEILKAFALGYTAEVDAAEIETHLADCPACIAVLDQTGIADPLVAAVRTASPAEADSADRVFVDRLQAVGRPADPAQTTDFSLRASTANHPLSVSDHDTEEGIAFLAPPLEPGEIGRLGPYRVLSQLGHGGMGMVFRAEDPGLRRPVALKVMRPRVAASAVAHRRFLAEAQAAAQFRHDHVVTIYQVGEDRGVPYLAMELLDGESLEDRLQNVGRISAVEVCRVGRETAQALSAAHAVGLVHRDIKPANLWLDSASGRTKVLDFGLARAAASDAGVTASGFIVGTPAYMAPEQARSESLDGRADLFALGVTLYRAATGVLPFQGRDAVSTLLAVTTRTPVCPNSVCPEVPAELSSLIMRLLEKNPSDRPATAAEVATELAQLERQLTTSPSSSPASPRRPWPMVAAGFFAVVLILAGITVIIRDKDGRKIAEVDVPEGGRIEVGPDPSASPASTPMMKPAEGPINIPEPPPLAEWLKGRDIVTVAQDGSGRFKTIQEALNAVRPGQVVKVLDRATYRERLELSYTRDIGLVSEHGATLELAGWLEQEVKVGHIFTELEGFRLHGFRIHYPNDDGRIGFRLTNCRGVVLENCNFTCVTQIPIKDRLGCVMSFDFDESYRSPTPQTIRGNRFGGCLSIHSRSDSTCAIIHRNDFTGRFEGAHLTIGGGRGDTVVVRDTVFDDMAMHGDVYVSALGLKRLEISNNLLSGRTPIGFFDSIAAGRVVIRNNLHIRTYLGFLASGAEKHLDAVMRDWQIDHNAYAEATTDFGWKVPMADLPKGAGDILGPVKFLSDEPAHSDYLRLPANDPRATGGAGKGWPTYMGPLPPGPAPKEGDWFTTIRKKWTNR